MKCIHVTASVISLWAIYQHENCNENNLSKFLQTSFPGSKKNILEVEGTNATQANRQTHNLQIYKDMAQ